LGYFLLSDKGAVVAEKPEAAQLDPVVHGP
jgi:hypothetical protein